MDGLLIRLGLELIVSLLKIIGGMDASIRMIANHRGCAKNAHVQCYSSLFPDLNIHCLPTLAPARFPKIKESFMHIYEGMLTTTP